ncbi:trypsin-like serine peptidase [Acidomonas methanolica]|uniref:trypsin-like serine peptidase n=1 Tax=Acidomonas methanolica TaxID=437 RepID=UPI00164AA13D|nr:trypsin-like serine protease [Acidomonas methanolica]MBU2653650.1 trypsin-like serine protease [Acidomonas methanolica]
MRRAALLLVACCLTAGPARAELPGLGDGTRTPVDVNAAPWRILGRVQTPLGTRCTGFLIAPAVIETAAHCLFIARTGRFIPAQDIHFLLGYRDGAFRAHTVARRYVIAAGYDPRDPQATPFADRAVVVLAEAVGREQDLVPAGRVQAGAAAMLAGYEQDRPEQAAGDLACHVTAVLPGPLLAHDCAGTRGVSGAPLLARDGAGRWRIAGLAVLARAGRGGFATLTGIMTHIDAPSEALSGKALRQMHER